MSVLSHYKARDRSENGEQIWEHGQNMYDRYYRCLGRGGQSFMSLSELEKILNVYIPFQHPPSQRLFLPLSSFLWRNDGIPRTVYVQKGKKCQGEKRRRAKMSAMTGGGSHIF